MRAALQPQILTWSVGCPDPVRWIPQQKQSIAEPVTQTSVCAEQNIICSTHRQAQSACMAADECAAQTAVLLQTLWPAAGTSLA